MNYQSFLTCINSTLIITTGTFTAIDSDNFPNILLDYGSPVYDDDNLTVPVVTINPTIFVYDLVPDQELLAFAVNTKDNTGYTANDMYAVASHIDTNYSIDLRNDTIAFTGYGQDLMNIITQILTALESLKTIPTGTTDPIDPAFTTTIQSISADMKTFLNQ